MPSKGSITKTIRLNAEDREYIEELMARENLSWSGAIHKLIEGTQGKVSPEENVTQNEIIDVATLKDLEQMCRLSGLTTMRFFDRIDELFNEGKIYVDGIQIKTKGDFDTRELVDVCHRVNADPQDMIDKLVKTLMRG